MKKRWIQFENDADREWEVIKHVTWNAVKLVFILMLSCLLVAGAEWAYFNKEKISEAMKRFDSKVDNHINHLMR